MGKWFSCGERVTVASGPIPLRHLSFADYRPGTPLPVWDEPDLSHLSRLQQRRAMKAHRRLQALHTAWMTGLRDAHFQKQDPSTPASPSSQPQNLDRRSRKALDQLREAYDRLTES